MSDDKPAPGNLIPITPDEFEQDIAIQLSAMRARKEPGAVRENPFLAKRLAERLLRCGLRPYREQVDPRAHWADPPGTKIPEHR